MHVIRVEASWFYAIYWRNRDRRRENGKLGINKNFEQISASKQIK